MKKVEYLMEKWVLEKSVLNKKNSWYFLKLVFKNVLLIINHIKDF